MPRSRGDDVFVSSSHRFLRRPGRRHPKGEGVCRAFVFPDGRPRKMSVASAADEWVTLRGGCRRLECSHYRFMKLVALGKIRVKADPGQSIRYSREDIEKLANEQK